MIAIAGVIVVAGAGGALLAVNSESSPNNASQNVEMSKEQPKKEEVKLSGWKEDSGSWYFYKDNEKQKNWIQDKNSWYYLSTDGKLRTGWIKDNENWYYLNKDGTMATNTTIDNCYLNDKGIIEETPTNTKPSVNNDTSVSVSKSKYVVTSFEQARNIILKEDGQYIQKLNNESSNPKSYVQLDNYKQETTNDEANCWGITNEECFTICVNDYYDGEIEQGSVTYLVGMRTGNVYILPHQGVCSAYQIKNNQVAKTFKCPEQTSHEWR